MRQQVYDAELRLTHTTELYNKEKIENKSNAIAFKQILKMYSNGGVPSERKESSDNTELTREYVQRLEEQLAEKDEEIKFIKSRLGKEPSSSVTFVSPFIEEESRVNCSNKVSWCVSW